MTVKANSVESVTFLITPAAIGNIELNVKGTTRQAGDSLVRLLKIVPKGQTQKVTRGTLLDLRSGRPYTTNLTAKFPDKRVPESDSIKVSVIGDVLGPAINNLDKLLGTNLHSKSFNVPCHNFITEFYEKYLFQNFQPAVVNKTWSNLCPT